MTEPSATVRMQAAQAFAMRLGHRDIDQAMHYLSPNVVYRVPGRHALAGSFHGVDAVLAHLLEFADRSGGTFDAYKFEDWLASENTVAAVLDAHLQGHGASVSERMIFLLGFDASDRIAAVSVFFENEDSIERFIGV
ncbi:MAG TPA: nuclear transport factor 2 family protein [Acidimicrobiales bacterium]